MAPEYGKLVVTRPDGTTFEVPIDKPRPIRIGRVARGADELVLDHDDAVSADHALITAVETGCYITDLGSQNGTRLNDEARPLEQQKSRLLRHGDEIAIGRHRIAYERRLLLPDGPAWQSSAPILPPHVAALRWQAERQPRAAAPIELARLRYGLAQPRLEHETSEYMRYLPALYHASNLINDLLLSCETVWQPIEETLDALHWYADPGLAPEGMLGWLASWFGIALDAQWPVGRQRQVIAGATRLLRWRGTRKGLVEWIELLTGLRPTIVEAGDEPALQPPLADHEFCVVFEQAQWDSADGALKDMVGRIVELEKPAQTIYRIASRPALPSGL